MYNTFDISQAYSMINQIKRFLKHPTKNISSQWITPLLKLTSTSAVVPPGIFRLVEVTSGSWRFSAYCPLDGYETGF